MINPGLRWLLAATALCLAAPLAAQDLETTQVRMHTLPMEQVLDGRIEAVQQATVSAQTSGRVVEVFFDVDDFVEEGDLILRLRDTEQRSRLEQAEAGLREARARYNEARSDYERIEDIFERQLVSRSEMDRATAALRSARARLESAQAAVEGAREELDHTRVVAPYAGILTERHVETGESVSPGQPLVSGISLEHLRVVTQVPQRHIQAVREHQQARVMLNGAMPVSAEGLTLFPYADPVSASFRVRVQLPDGTPGLFPGMFVKVAFAVGEQKRLLVPTEAVMQRGEVSAVYVVDEDGRIRLRQVRTGRAANQDHVQVLAGLEAGERVAVDPVRAGITLKAQREAAR
ncbi:MULTISPECIES: efflux RND transporter periplasmic adaptor subunit [Ectothiorhodospira]|uniref:RND family efflux transporter, MFP subunit n=1 Tax=Ectothiorhodospira marina TaxID=1396821 RepID=A0A1H7L7N3_9GAMM|nr:MULTISPECIES: efflux RND transporter periplasmic adaptor subunit [Ectothiorhodospira]MCG5515710.1 efflux RND transporter periplasmic adaptor subunit [Ectothiorhodospira sp. 9100]MCG5518506.1 efflux RND transporter periplasmic adaptor subunit [Ectothiorhodospira sp. 9905]SEK94969.1 RND family efflux transporter, MFP subunit [Ectothiorhodospira marina]